MNTLPTNHAIQRYRQRSGLRLTNRQVQRHMDLLFKNGKDVHAQLPNAAYFRSCPGNWILIWSLRPKGAQIITCYRDGEQDI